MLPKCVAAPVSGGAHPDRNRGEAGGIRPEDARPERDGTSVGQGADRLALLVGEAALRADQDRGWRGGDSVKRRAALLVGEEEGAAFRPGGKHRLQLLRLNKLGQRRALALLRRFDGMCAQAIEV